MAASRFDTSQIFPACRLEMPEQHLALPASAIQLRRSGVEFHSPEPFPVWAEMTVALRMPDWAWTLRCTGVVVACEGNRHAGFTVSVLFLNAPPVPWGSRSQTAGQETL